MVKTHVFKSQGLNDIQLPDLSTTHTYIACIEKEQWLQLLQADALLSGLRTATWHVLKLDQQSKKEDKM